jgi:hypothetical protein
MSLRPLGVSIARLSLVLAYACAPRPAPSATRELTIAARTPDGKAVALVQCWRDGTLLGATDADGQLRTRVVGRPSQTITFSFACPAEYATSTPKRSLLLAGVEHATAASPITLRVECRSLEIATAVVVRAHGASLAGLPVRVRGEAVAQTDAHGHAHTVVRSRPGTTLRVELDTRSEPALRPDSPSRAFALGTTDGFVLFDQAFSREPPRRAQARAAPPTPSAITKKPYRID